MVIEFVICAGRSLIIIANNKLLNEEPCGTPSSVFFKDEDIEVSFLTIATNCSRLYQKDFNNKGLTPYHDNLCSKMSRSILSKAFAMSSETTIEINFLSRLR
jgi:hypothetical protein